MKSKLWKMLVLSPYMKLILEDSPAQNYQNPFNPSTKIKYTIPNVIATPFERGKQSQYVSLKIYDVLGNEVSTLVNEEKAAGTYEIEFSVGQSASGGSSPDIASGVYFYQLQVGNFSQSKKMILIR